MRHKKLFSILILALAFSVPLLPVFGAEPLQPAVQDKCPVCGMAVHPYPQWTAQIVLKDGTRAFFDGPKDMLKYYFNLAKYAKNKTQNDIDAIYVTDYYTTKPADAKSVVFVTGSDVVGPMGKELVPMAADKAEAFMKDHKGEKALKFSEITPADVPDFTGQHSHHGPSHMKDGNGHGASHMKEGDPHMQH